MTKREAGINVVREMMGDQAAAKLSASADSNAFGAPIAAYALDQAFADIWTRPGLDRRSRSLVSMSVTVGTRSRYADKQAVEVLAFTRSVLSLFRDGHTNPQRQLRWLLRRYEPVSLRIRPSRRDSERQAGNNDGCHRSE
jgi:alkylhydroperoxidase/carboxymuconolactone decarboxylase family protein YurZ